MIFFSKIVFKNTFIENMTAICVKSVFIFAEDPRQCVNCPKMTMVFNGVENIAERHSGKDHYIGFVNQNTKSMLTIMLTWLTGVRQRLIFTEYVQQAFNEECEGIQKQGHQT